MQKLDPKVKIKFYFQHMIVVITILFFGGGWLLSLIITNIALLGVVSIILVITVPIGTSILYYNSYEYEITATGFHKVFGVINRRSTTIPFDRIQNVDIIRSLFSRILGLSDLFVQTAGGSAFGTRAEGKLVGISKAEAERLQSDLTSRQATTALPAQPAAQPPVIPAPAVQPGMQQPTAVQPAVIPPPQQTPNAAQQSAPVPPTSPPPSPGAQTPTTPVDDSDTGGL